MPRYTEDTLVQETVMLAEFDAETRFRLRAARGHGKQKRGLELLRKAAGKARPVRTKVAGVKPN